MRTKAFLLALFFVIGFFVINIIPEPEVEPVSTPVVALAEPDPEQLTCLAHAIFFEAGNQSIHGKEAISTVIFNRMKDRVDSTVCSVIDEWKWKYKRKVCQFSFRCERHGPPTGTMWDQSFIIARMNLMGVWITDTNTMLREATHYHADYVKPYWSKRLGYVATIGNHVFFTQYRVNQNTVSSVYNASSPPP